MIPIFLTHESKSVSTKFPLKYFLVLSFAHKVRPRRNMFPSTRKFHCKKEPTSIISYSFRRAETSQYLNNKFPCTRDARTSTPETKNRAFKRPSYKLGRTSKPIRNKRKRECRAGRRVPPHRLRA